MAEGEEAFEPVAAFDLVAEGDAAFDGEEEAAVFDLVAACFRWRSRV